MTEGNQELLTNLRDAPEVGRVRASVIIVNWKVRTFLRRCLESLEGQLGNETEVIVVDNDSQDGSQAMLAESFPHVQVIANEKNLGHGAAMNQGAAMARGEVLIFANPDLLFRPDCLPTLTAFMEAHPEAVAATGKILGDDGRLHIGSRRGRYDIPSLIVDALGIAAHRPSAFPSLDHYLQEAPEGEVGEVESISGVLLVIRRDDFFALGGFDGRLNHACQDIDLSYRVRDAGGKIFYVPQAEVLHFQGRSTAQWRKHRGVQFLEKAIFLGKNLGSLAAALHVILLPPAILAGLLAPREVVG